MKTLPMRNDDFQKPLDCTLIVGIPVLMEDFDRFKVGRINSDFLASSCTSRLKFFNEISLPVVSTLRKIKKYNCEILIRPRNQDVLSAFKKKVVIIFSHYNGELLELNGTLLSDKDFCRLVPPDYDGIIDLCACQPNAHLVVSLKQHVPRARIKHTIACITPAIWIEVIRLTIKHIAEYRLNYLEATNLVLQQILKKYQGLNIK